MQMSDEIPVILRALQEITITVELLKETKIGVLVNKCRKKYGTNAEIANCCKTLIDEWKKVAEAPRKPSLDARSSEAKSSDATSSEDKPKPLKKPIEMVNHSSSASKEAAQTEVIEKSLVPPPDGTASDQALTPREDFDFSFDEYLESLNRSRRQVR